VHAERGVLEESVPLPSEAQVQRRGEQHHIGKRCRLRKRGEPVVELLARRAARQSRLLRRHLPPKQPIGIDDVDRRFDREVSPNRRRMNKN
jgi:hypothetical protein